MDSFHAAGVLVYCIYNDTIYFLLGKESNSGLYCDFGGNRENNESSYDTAVREFDEETMGTICDKKIMEKLIYNLPCYKNHNYMTYILKIKYNPDVIRTYNTFINKLNKCQISSCHGYLEKSELRWFTIKELLHNKHLMRPTFFKSFTHYLLH